jgi:hypothetical protein
LQFATVQTTAHLECRNIIDYYTFVAIDSPDPPPNLGHNLPAINGSLSLFLITCPPSRPWPITRQHTNKPNSKLRKSALPRCSSRFFSVACFTNSTSVSRVFYILSSLIDFTYHHYVGYENLPGYMPVEEFSQGRSSSGFIRMMCNQRMIISARRSAS